MGTYVVAARSMEPEPWAPQKPQNLLLVGCLVTPEAFSKFDFSLSEGGIFPPMCLYSKYSEFCGEFKNV